MGGRQTPSSAAVGNAGRRTRAQANLDRALHAAGHPSPASASVGWVRNFLAMSGDRAAAATITSSASRVMGGAFVVLGLGRMAFSILDAGFDAMTTRRRHIDVLASAYAYPYWLFSHQNLPWPHRPRALRRSHEYEDEIGNHDGIDSATFRRHWNRGVSRTSRALERSFQRVQLSSIRLQINFRAPQAPAIDWPDEDCRNMLKIMTCSEYNNDPSVAALAYFLWRTKDMAKADQRALNSLYRRHPYRNPRPRRRS